jgi:hypothetical protein
MLAITAVRLGHVGAEFRNLQGLWPSWHKCRHVFHSMPSSSSWGGRGGVEKFCRIENYNINVELLILSLDFTCIPSRKVTKNV